MQYLLTSSFYARYSLSVLGKQKYLIYVFKNTLAHSFFATYRAYILVLRDNAKLDTLIHVILTFFVDFYS